MELYYHDPSRLDAALSLLRNACRIADAAPTPGALILETLD